jgi:hypothetical protein
MVVEMESQAVGKVVAKVAREEEKSASLSCSCKVKPMTNQKIAKTTNK